MITRKQNTDLGVVLTLILLVISLWHEVDLYKVCVTTLLITALFPAVFTPLSYLWYAFARLAERLFSAILLALVFYGLITPIGLVHRVFAKDSLHIRHFKKSRESVFVIKDKRYEAEDLEYQY
ncbi:MAG: hypothetical protein LBQ65_09470 [Tannerellaceae bacterium]|jgi:hypothetical protein|nr:hypothetical protein [Tannerellaceae bacterium]